MYVKGTRSWCVLEEHVKDNYVLCKVSHSRAIDAAEKHTKARLSVKY